MSDTGSTDLNSKYAWRKLARRGLPKRPAAERAADCLEIYGLYDEATAREQASRCVQCPNPSCVTGCPLCNPIPEWMQLTAEGRFLEAAAVLGSVSNMVDICTRLCPSDHLCEGNCILDSVSEPVAIQALEQFLADYALAHGLDDSSTAAPNGLKVAVVGSGAGGLACADALAKQGYAVTVFDSALVPGGLLVHGTPAFKLDRSLVQHRVELLQKRGVAFRLGVKLWDDPTLARLRAEHDAVYLGFDWRKARPLELPGAELDGVIQAVPFLLQKTTAIPLNAPRVEVDGKRVVVLGGGDTAMDCLRSALRYGATQATCVYRREERDMPCGRQEYQNALEEGAQFVFQAVPVAVLGNSSGWVSGLRLRRTRVELPDESGRRPFQVEPDTEFDLETNWVIAALGFDALALPQTEDFSAVKLNPWGGIVVDERQMTSLPGVFAGGDLVRGPSHVLNTVRDARRAAAQIHAFLQARRALPTA